MYKVPKEKIVSINFSGALFSLLDFLITVDGNDRLYQNVDNELTLYTAWYPRRAHILHDDLVMQALVLLCEVQFWEIQFGVVHFGISYANLRPLHIFKHRFKEETSSGIQVNMVVS